jgi:hypothetical protein
MHVHIISVGTNEDFQDHLEILLPSVNCNLIRLKGLVFLDNNPRDSAKTSNKIYVTGKRLKFLDI